MLIVNIFIINIFFFNIAIFIINTLVSIYFLVLQIIDNFLIIFVNCSNIYSKYNIIAIIFLINIIINFFSNISFLMLFILRKIVLKAKIIVNLLNI